MAKRCNVCESTLDSPIYDSRSEQSLTSLCQLYPGSTQVWSCSCCGHLMSNSFTQTEAYYANEYKILLNHEDEDQIYEVNNGEIVYRSAHQMSVLNHKIKIKSGYKILDYGCAKATMAKILLERNPNLDFHFFDVSEMYLSYWKRLVKPEKWAVGNTPLNWLLKFDLITSFFSLEHISELRQVVEHIASLLKEDGTFYAVLPDTFGNVADFVVIDHVNHFTHNSIFRLFQDAGFKFIEVDDESHRGALVVIARKHGEVEECPPLADLKFKVHELAHYWSDVTTQISNAEAGQSGSAAIYGSGFYGAFIYSCLKSPATIQFFLDQNPYQQGRKLFDVPIIAPDELPEGIKTLYVGLNPKIAQQVMGTQTFINRSGLKIVFLASVI
jgi:SAM-dependent methyltransferase